MYEYSETRSGSNIRLERESFVLRWAHHYNRNGDLAVSKGPFSKLHLWWTLIQFPGILCVRDINKALDNVQHNILIRMLNGRLRTTLSVAGLHTVM
jgi:hypothetical protein